MKEKFLPIGTVVSIKTIKSRVLITGYAQIRLDKEKPLYYDYCAVLYPQGLLKTDQILVFNHEDITKIYNEVFQDADTFEYLEMLKNNINDEVINKAIKEMEETK